MIHIEKTSDPQSLNFVIEGRVLLPEGTAHFRSLQEAKGSWLPEQLFSLNISEVFIERNYITITKYPEVRWDSLIPEIENILRACLTGAALRPLILDEHILK